MEDRRVEAEKHLISMKIELDSVKKQFQLSKENYHKLKVTLQSIIKCTLVVSKPSRGYNFIVFVIQMRVLFNNNIVLKEEVKVIKLIVCINL